MEVRGQLCVRSQAAAFPITGRHQAQPGVLHARAAFAFSGQLYLGAFGADPGQIC